MPELTPHSTPTPNPLPPSLFASPPADPPEPPGPPAARPQDPEDPPLFPWEAHPAFRFTFLLHFTQPGDREALEHIGRMLYDSALELAGKWPRGQESPTRAELRAIAADLRYAESFIASVVCSLHVATLSFEDERLTYMVDEVGRDVGRTAKILETLIGRLWTGGYRS